MYGHPAILPRGRYKDNGAQTEFVSAGRRFFAAVPPVRSPLRPIRIPPAGKRVPRRQYRIRHGRKPCREPECYFRSPSRPNAASTSRFFSRRSSTVGFLPSFTSLSTSSFKSQPQPQPCFSSCFSFIIRIVLMSPVSPNVSPCRKHSKRTVQITYKTPVRTRKYLSAALRTPQKLHPAIPFPLHVPHCSDAP